MTTYTIKTSKFSVISLHNNYEEKKIIKSKVFHKKSTKKPNNIFIDLIKIQKEKEIKYDIWTDSIYKDLIKLQLNNIGIIGETFIQEICNICNIPAYIDGVKTKELGGGFGDGKILDKNIEIKTSHRGCKTPSFQHELGETPWYSDILIFIDISPKCIYLTIFKNFTEEFYKKKQKCIPYFPTKSITWRKKTGAFKLDTTIKINEENIINGYSFKINENSNLINLKYFILSSLK